MQDQGRAKRPWESPWTNRSLLAVFTALLIFAAIPWKTQDSVPSTEVVDETLIEIEPFYTEAEPMVPELPQPMEQQTQVIETVRVIDTVVLAGGAFDASESNIFRDASLWGLAQKYYGDPYLWPYIYSFNRDEINNPNLLEAGAQIKIPALKNRPAKLSLEDKEELTKAYRVMYDYFNSRRSAKAKAIQ